MINLLSLLIFLIWILTGSLKKCGYTLFSGIKGFLIRSWFVSNDKLAIIIDISYLNPDRILEEMWLHAFIRNQRFPQGKMANPFKILIGSYQDLAQKYQRFSLGKSFTYLFYQFTFHWVFLSMNIKTVIMKKPSTLSDWIITSSSDRLKYLSKQLLALVLTRKICGPRFFNTGIIYICTDQSFSYYSSSEIFWQRFPLLLLIRDVRNLVFSSHYRLTIYRIYAFQCCFQLQMCITTGFQSFSRSWFRP
jgi:hypothetical protein